MSNRITAEVWTSTLPPRLRYVALAIAELVDGHGRGDPSVPELARLTGQTDRTVQAALADLEAGGALTREPRTGNSTAYVFTPEKFSPPPPQELHPSAPTPAESSPPPDKPLKGNGHDRAAALRVLEFLNQHAGKNFHAVAANLELIMARLAEYDENTLRGVILDRVDVWAKDDKMADYLRPATLFNKTKCAQYVGGLPK